MQGPFEGIFYCERFVLNTKTNTEIDNFIISRPGAKGIMDYLQQHAAHDEMKHSMVTYLVRDTESDELVAFFSVRAGSVKLDFLEDYSGGTYPGMELAYFGINERYLESHPDAKGCGVTIFARFIKPLALKMRELIGIRGIYGYAVDGTTLMDRYVNVYGFNRLSPDNEKQLHATYRPDEDDGCIFIYMDI